MLAGFDVWREPCEYLTRIADERDINLYVFVDFSTVDLNVDFARALGVGAQVASDAIIKTHAHGNEQVGFLNGVVDPSFAVHTHHAEVEGIIGREAADAEECHGHRIIAGVDELLKGAHRAGNHDAMAGENDGAFGGVQHLDSAVEFCLVVIVAPALGRSFGTDASQLNSAEACCASLVMSTRTGPGRPLLAIRKASRRVRATSSALVTTTLCLVMGMVMPVMSIS